MAFFLPLLLLVFLLPLQNISTAAKPLLLAAPASSLRRKSNANPRYTDKVKASTTPSSSSDQSPSPYSLWVTHHCGLVGNELYLRVPTSFIDDPVTRNAVYASYNSTATSSSISLVDDAIRLMTDLPKLSPSSTFNRGSDYDEEEYDNNNEEENEEPSLLLRKKIETVADEIYNLFHGKFVLSNEGLRSVKVRFRKRAFGQCPRVICRGNALLPLGLHNQLGKSTVKCFCSKCKDHRWR
jgi:hypothetical protein